MAPPSLAHSLPTEIVLEVVRQSDAPTLAVWCRLSRSFLAFAGPLLYHHVTLTNPEDVTPFCNSIMLAYSNYSPPPHLFTIPFLKHTKRLDILDPPFEKGNENLFCPAYPQLSEPGPILRVDWKDEDSGRAALWVQDLFFALNPRRYEETGRVEDTYLSGALLGCYRSYTISGFSDGEDAWDAHHAFVNLALMQLTALEMVNKPRTIWRERLHDSLGPLVPQLEEKADAIMRRSVLEPLDITFHNATHLQEYVDTTLGMVREFLKIAEPILEESVRLQGKDTHDVLEAAEQPRSDLDEESEVGASEDGASETEESEDDGQESEEDGSQTEDSD